MDEFEILRCEIQSEIYERQIRALIDKLLEIDEMAIKAETELEPKVQSADRSAA
jgi:hypothetical protein